MPGDRYLPVTLLAAFAVLALPAVVPLLSAKSALPAPVPSTPAWIASDDDAWEDLEPIPLFNRRTAPPPAKPAARRPVATAAAPAPESAAAPMSSRAPVHFRGPAPVDNEFPQPRAVSSRSPSPRPSSVELATATAVEPTTKWDASVSEAPAVPDYRSDVVVPEATSATPDSWFSGVTPASAVVPVDAEWSWQNLPDGLLYKAYLAGVKEPRMATTWLYEMNEQRVIWESTLGGKVGLFRYGTPGPGRADGWQLDLEGAVFPRLNPESSDDLDAADFRIGLPLSYRTGPLAVKFGYNHISSHIGDEYMLTHPFFNRVNYVRDSLVLGAAYDLSYDVRTYAELGWAWAPDGGAEPLELQFGAEYSPYFVRGFRGTPYMAAHMHLREEFGYGGNFNAMAGWQWRGETNDRTYRLGAQYFNGKSMQYSFFNEHEELLGIGMWLDF